MAQNSKTRYWSKDQYDPLFFSRVARALLLQVRPIGAGWVRRFFTSMTNKRGSRGVSALWKKPKRPLLNGDGGRRGVTGCADGVAGGGRLWQRRLILTTDAAFPTPRHAGR
jgi:hypothetical protein